MKYSDLRVWQEAMNLVIDVYKLSKAFPSEEQYGLTSQIQRAAVSVPSNIAEGHGRKSTSAYTNYLSIALGSLMELETQIQIALRLDYASESEVLHLLSRTDQVGKMLSALKNSLNK